LRTKIFIDCGLFFWRYHHLNYFLLCHCQHILHFINIVCGIAMSNVEFDCLFFHIEIRCGFNLIFDGLRLAHIERSNYIESNTLGRKRCSVSGIERIRYSGCFITVKIEGKIWDRWNRPVSWGFRYWEDPV